MLVLAAFGGVCSNGGASVRVCSVVGDGARAHGCVLAGLARARCSVAQYACHAGDRVEGRRASPAGLRRGVGAAVWRCKVCSS